MTEESSEDLIINTSTGLSGSGLQSRELLSALSTSGKALGATLPNTLHSSYADTFEQNLTEATAPHSLYGAGNIPPRKCSLADCDDDDADCEEVKD